ncbi:RimJ/RimL family protein N-acetyltransferase [Serratia fonticola]|uniref:RimJ/RimL family protein N-acetyltransferase n=1 Tax=Serratia fonticola TaxID=47917 RepID=A0A559TC92_SERFO|nr:GNAT family protein [Serratia fonticola]TQI80259.1 RimJ/RimL family protein N-acetyltransferase [Serratia fonticola]TQI97714.1 RimJ/RimL family protein N-acetyltransferase [Serratia fonticola]TVZ72212.1 RimJ/RimL family protein N-acetyltransferase [Serratia fonticola]
MTINQYGQPVGDPLPHWQALARPKDVTLNGRFCHLVLLDAERDFAALFDAFHQAPDGRDWTYLMRERPDSPQELRTHLINMQDNPELVNLTVFDASSQLPVGTVAFMRIDAGSGVLEIGHVCWSPLMKQRSCATEAIYLMLKHTFDALGYRRCEWKCDSLNAPSRQAAQRFGFNYEGRFLKALVTKGRNRDTDWFAMTEDDWPRVRNAFEQWLDEGNFDAEGQQKQRLSAFMPWLGKE